jgi:hypothetical protein
VAEDDSFYWHKAMVESGIVANILTAAKHIFATEPTHSNLNTPYDSVQFVGEIF